MIRVVVADDQALVRTGIRKILESEPDIEVVDEAEDGQAAALSAPYPPARRRSHGHPDAQAQRPGRDSNHP